MTACRHTAAPDGYLAWHAWAERKSQTHTQHRCDGCGLWKIWRRRAALDKAQELMEGENGG